MRVILGLYREKEPSFDVSYNNLAVCTTKTVDAIKTVEDIPNDAYSVEGEKIQRKLVQITIFFCFELTFCFSIVIFKQNKNNKNK